MQDEIEDLLGSAKYIQSFVYRDFGTGNLDTLSSFFNSLLGMVESLTGCTCDKLR